MGIHAPKARPGLALLLAFTAGAFAGCSDADEPMASPDANAVFVFFPSGSSVSTGLVRGRGLPGSVPRDATHVIVESYPTGHSVVVEVAPDGAFDFQIIAISGDVLELRGAQSERLEGLGQPTFIRVPPSIDPVVPFICCPETNTCVELYLYEQTDIPVEERCSPPTPGIPTCTTDAQCGIFENEYLPLDPNRVQVSAPSADGLISVEGTLVPNTLITLINRGKSAVAGGLNEEERRRRGLEDPNVRVTQITDEAGRFRFERLRAIADDELVLSFEDLRGFSSPLYATRVPDPELVGVDVLGVFPWEPLTNGDSGTIAIRIAPYGADGRGICPDQPISDDGLELCMGGGLDHAMIPAFSRATIDFAGGGSGADLSPRETAVDAVTTVNRGLEGNPYSGSLDLMVVLDMSGTSAAADADGITFEAARSYVRYLRARDRVGLVSFGSDTSLQVPLTNDRGAVDAALARLASTTREGPNNLFEGARLAAETLADRGTRAPGRIVVITFGMPSGTLDEARAARDRVLDLAERNSLAGFEGYPIDVVGVPIPSSADTLSAVENLATFTQGRLLSAAGAPLLEQTLADLRGEQVGSFILLYDIDVPINAGKAGTIRLEFDLQLGSSTRRGAYEGPLFIANAPNP